ncbi:hypothetical protein [Tsuneonella amylolytica]|uniref:hypothetical protein n=1 Tax=Tsuneonella amylolytica TaxID=2338327 RepID=UPI0013C4AD46|nr:hypothetical protein [Tsuneonella amylolytica]
MTRGKASAIGLRAGAAGVAIAMAAPVWAEQAEGPAAGDGSIVVTGYRQTLELDLVVEDELNRADIDAYGYDNIGQVLEQIGAELRTGDDGPVVLINGERANGVNDVNDLPVEAATRVQVLSRDAAAKLGLDPSRRVVNVVVKPDLAQVTLSGKAGAATRGDTFQTEGEANFLKLANGNRRSVVLRASHRDPLFESQRGIVSGGGAIPYALDGNVVGLTPGSEIDPALSALAGAFVEVAGLPPGRMNPSLQDFAATAGRPNPAGDGRFRTLSGTFDSLSANGNLSQRFSPKTNMLVNLKLDRIETANRNGLAPALLTLPAGSSNSPFGQPVGLAFLIGDALTSRQTISSLDLSQTINTTLGRFGLTFRTGLLHRDAKGTNDRGYDTAALQLAIDTGALDPFDTAALRAAVPLEPGRSRSRADSVTSQASLSGPLLSLPAGPLQLAATLQGRFDRSVSETRGSVESVRRFERDEVGARTNLTAPILARGNRDGFGLNAQAGAYVHSAGRGGALTDWNAGLDGSIGRVVNFAVGYQRQQIAPPASALNDPVIVLQNVRLFDFVRNESVVVPNIIGGNPDLPVQSRRLFSAQATVRPFADYDLAFTAEYARASNRDVFAALPPVSAAVQAAFPDRFVRDAAGALVLVDSRPVAFAREASESLRWGLRFRRTFAGSGVVDEESDQPRALAGRGVRVTFDLTHDWNLSNTRQARAALPVIDLLRGGAIGYGGGVSRHSVLFNGAVAGRGVGLSFNGQYRGRNVLSSGTVAAPGLITFPGRLVANVRTFANVGTLLPERDWARSLRLSVEVANLFDSRQRVRDETGATPLRYQPFLIDPVGRTINVGVRKAF